MRYQSIPDAATARGPRRVRESRSPRRRLVGQGLTEYIIIVALIALGSVVAVGFFGTAIKSQFVSMSASLVGQPDDTALTNVGTAVQAETTAAGTKATLGTYGQ